MTQLIPYAVNGCNTLNPYQNLNLNPYQNARLYNSQCTFKRGIFIAPDCIEIRRQRFLLFVLFLFSFSLFI